MASLVLPQVQEEKREGVALFFRALCPCIARSSAERGGRGKGGEKEKERRFSFQSISFQPIFSFCSFFFSRVRVLLNDRWTILSSLPSHAPFNEALVIFSIGAANE